MTILLRWLIDNAWIFYVACGVGALIYVVRALTALRERGLALFTLERESATARLVQSWLTVLAFFALAAVIFATTRYLLPEVPLLDPSVPLPTATLMAGVEPVTPSPGPSPTPQAVFNTPAPDGPEVEDEPSPTIPPPPPTRPPDDEPTPTPDPGASPTLLPTQVAAQPVSGDLSVRFGEFARLVGYSVSTARTTSRTPLLLTLYWQALDRQSPIDYVVFTHLLAEDGHLVAQHDGPPGGGSKPTTSWRPGESIVDLHTMEFKDSGYLGQATLLVGFYAPSGERIGTETGADHVALPVTIAIVTQ
jgi:hypothetical protein